MKVLKYLLIVIFLGITFFGIYNIISEKKEYQEAVDTYEDLEKYVNIPEENIDELQDEIIWPNVDFASLKSINSNVFAWIYIGNTNINYPIVQGKDNDYYLTHLIDGSYNSVGSIFLDYRNNNNFTDRHTIIYGHHTRNSTMFTELNKYKEQSFYEKQPYYLIVTSDKKYKVDIIAGYVTDVESDSWKLNFSSDYDFENWLNTTKDKSLINSDVVVDKNDRIITLSTCNHDFDNARFVLVGVLNELK